MVLEIVISGLVAFVRSSCTLYDAQSMKIVMVKGDMETHQPRLLIDTSSVTHESAAADKVLDLPDGKHLAIWYLENQQIKLVGKLPKLRIYEGHRTKKDEQYSETSPEDDPPEDFSWGPEMYRACGVDQDKAYPRTEVQQDNSLTYTVEENGKEEVVKFAIARFAALEVENAGKKRLKGDNYLQAEINEIQEEKPPKVFEFGLGGFKQAVADRARLAMKLPKDGLIEIRLTNLEKTTDVRRIFLKKDQKRVSVAVSNLPEKTPSQPAPPEKLWHFHEYVKLLQNSKTIKCPVPERVGKDLAKSSDPAEMMSAHPVKCTICVDCGPP